MTLDQDSIKTISKQIYRRFPEMDGCKPIVQEQSTPRPKSFISEPTFVITYQKIARSQMGKTIPRRVRVVADLSGKILRVSTSR
jgi:hypothetical protein